MNDFNWNISEQAEHDEDGMFVSIGMRGTNYLDKTDNKTVSGVVNMKVNVWR